MLYQKISYVYVIKKSKNRERFSVCIQANNSPHVRNSGFLNPGNIKFACMESGISNPIKFFRNPGF